MGERSGVGPVPRGVAGVEGSHVFLSCPAGRRGAQVAQRPAPLKRFTSLARRRVVKRQTPSGSYSLSFLPPVLLSPMS